MARRSSWPTGTWWRARPSKSTNRRGRANVAMLVVGDPVCATTHTDMMIRAKEFGVKVELIHNASAMGAAGCCGLQLYNFGQTVSIPFFDDNWRPTSFYPKIKYNRGGGMHTLCLLDIKVKEPDFEATTTAIAVTETPSK